MRRHDLVHDGLMQCPKLSRPLIQRIVPGGTLALAVQFENLIHLVDATVDHAAPKQSNNWNGIMRKCGMKQRPTIGPFPVLSPNAGFLVFPFRFYKVRKRTPYAERRRAARCLAAPACCVSHDRASPSAVCGMPPRRRPWRRKLAEGGSERAARAPRPLACCTYDPPYPPTKLFTALRYSTLWDSRRVATAEADLAK
ncbi:hypothetical protein HPB49_022247 [Dermacentor silvarum]|uniref:Uncharacterized protein n=1 Tax=Dermacentor silvarum TaxID=543639 RepID=A0ACB8E3L4_DERSI|nr:hypothetical protein HPB49_022247 [Dermacentor silvarum]